MQEYYLMYGRVILAPLFAIVLDVAMGFIAAARNGTIDSTVMRRGIWTKLSEIGAIILAVFLEFALSVYGDLLHIHVDVPLHYAMCAYITLYEVVSVLENIGKMNPTIANAFIKVIGIKPDKMNMVPVEEEEEDESDAVESDCSVC